LTSGPYRLQGPKPASRHVLTSAGKIVLSFGSNRRLNPSKFPVNRK
jgi:hypothetical protein